MSKKIKFNDLKFEPHKTIDGIHCLKFFDNGYGASIVRHYFSYGNEDGLYELAVLKGKKDNWSICYDTEITDDVIGYLSEEEVAEILNEIKNLTGFTSNGHEVIKETKLLEGK